MPNWTWEGEGDEGQPEVTGAQLADLICKLEDTMVKQMALLADLTGVLQTLAGAAHSLEQTVQAVASEGREHAEDVLRRVRES